MMIPTRQAPELILGHWQLLQQMGAAPAELVWDNEPAVESWRSGRPRLAREFEAFRGTSGIGVRQCRPRDPEAEGLVERANGYVETSFLPGREFTSPTDFNNQLTTWLTRANTRHHHSLGCRPVDRWAADTAAMVALPPVPRRSGWRLITRLPLDHYVRLDANDYSVDPVAVGRAVEVVADLDTVTVTVTWATSGRIGGDQVLRIVARHQRCWARHQTITDVAHRAAALALATPTTQSRTGTRSAVAARTSSSES